jgi:predicted TIM-barrel fold metal-dependent hydrolase
MSTREEWLALGAEPPLEPELPICDPHHHLWIYPESRYLVEDFLADARGGHRILCTVHVECLMFYRDATPEALRPVGETAHIDHITASTQERDTRVAAGIVGFADLRLGEAVAPVLEAHATASTRFRGVRFGTAWDPSERIHSAHTKPAPGLLLDPVFRAGLRCVERQGLVFDAWMYFPQLPELVELARALPGLGIVLDHAGGPIGIGSYADRREEVFATWQSHMRALASCPNVLVKLGGLTMSMAGFGWHKRAVPPSSLELATAMRPYFMTCIELFGVERCMFESNFPMDRVSCSYTVLWNAFKRVAGAFSAAERRALFHDNAVRAYRL